jgi:phosphate transport system substrate-binding protein
MLALVASGVLALGAAACGSSSKKAGTSSSGGASSGADVQGTLTGAGSTLAAPVYQQWGNDLKGKGLTLNYNPIGSGGGVAQFTAGTVNFAGSDPALKDPEVAAAQSKGDPVHIPTVFGAITVSYNLSNVKAGLKLDGPTIAGIFLGTIKKWNDPAITKLNPGVTLPSGTITVVHRSDASGTTKGFTGFLAAESPQWKSKVGTDKTVPWPTGTGAKGNQGVAGAIKQTDGSIGYVESAFALQNNFTFADVKNKSGTFVAPTLASTSAAGDGLSVPADLRFTAINSPNPKAYPIVSQTFVLVYKDLCKGGLSPQNAKALVGFLDYGLGAGQQVAEKLSYAPLPSSLADKAKAAVSGLQCNGAPVK